MKIVLLADAWQPITGGGQQLFWQLVSGLVKKHRCQITVVTRAIRHTDGKKYNKNQTLFKGRLKIIRLGPSFAWPNLLGRIWFTLQALIYSLRLKPNLFIASTFLPGFSLQLIKLFKKTPNVLVAIGFGAKNKLFQWLEKIITQWFKYDLLITDDYQYYQAIKTSRKTKFIPNGVSLPPKHGKQMSDKDKYKHFTFLFVGRNQPRKGVPILNQAFITVKHHFPQVKLNIIGPGFKLVSPLQLEREFYKSHCFVLPSLQEGHPLVLFEAWAHQLPVIATDVGSVSQFLNQSNGYLVPPGDSTKLAQTMIKAIKNKKLALLGKNGYQLVSQNYSWSKTIFSYYQVLTSLLQ